ncbi:MAG: hypothetical protein NVSMB9_29830 [Isosphaeraceae bacterium]
MPAGNQGQGQGKKQEGQGPQGQHDRNNSGANAAKDTPQSVVQNVQHGAEQVGQRVQEGYGAVKKEATRRYRRAEGTIARNPSPSLLIGFGVGFGLGLALTSMLGHREETWTEKYMPDSLRNLPDSLRNVRIPESVRDAHVPASLHHTFHHLAESIRDLPSLIAKASGH